MHVLQRVVVWMILATAGCASDVSSPSNDNGGAAAPPAPLLGCLASNECPSGTICNELQACVAPPAGNDAGVPAETEIALGAPTSSDRYVYVYDDGAERARADRRRDPRGELARGRRGAARGRDHPGQ